MLFRVLFLILLSSVSHIVEANDILINQLYELSNLSLREKSNDNFLKSIHELEDNNSDNDSLYNLRTAFISLLKSEYYSLKSDYKESKRWMEVADSQLETLKNPRLTIERKYIKIFQLRLDNDITSAIHLSEELLSKDLSFWPDHKVNQLILELAYLKSYVYQYNESLDLLKEALIYADKGNDLYQLAETFNLFGIIYQQIKDYQSSNLYYQKAVELAKKYDYSTDISFLYTNLAESYRLIKDLPKAETLFHQSINIAKKDNNVIALSFAYHMYSRLLKDRQEIDKAIENLTTAYDLLSETGDDSYLYEMNLELSYLYIKKEMYEKAKTHLAMAKKNTSKNVDKEQYLIRKISAKIYASEKNYEEAYHELEFSYNKYEETFNDNLLSLSTISRKQLEKEKLFFENKLLTQENIYKTKVEKSVLNTNRLLIIFLSLFLLFIILLTWLLIKYKKIAIKNKMLSLTDVLSSLPNRRNIFEQLEDALSKSIKEFFSFAVIMFDIDFFKKINDNYGHEAGDNVIRSINAICSAALRNRDVVGRIGGEEFLILLPNTDLASAVEVAKRIQLEFKSFDYNTISKDLKVTCSFGVTEYIKGDLHTNTIVNRADERLYQAKNSGRDNVVS